MSRKTVKEGNSRTGKITAAGRGQITGPLTAAKTKIEMKAGMKAGEAKARIVRDIRIIKGIRLAAALVINLLVITGALLDRIAETQLPENEAGRVKALQWMHRQLRQKRDRRMKNGAEIRTETDVPERI